MSTPQQILFSTSYSYSSTNMETKSATTTMRKWGIFVPRSETKKFKLRLVVCELEGLPIDEITKTEKFAMEVRIKSKAPRENYLSRKAILRDCTSKQPINPDGCVRWNQGFEQICRIKEEHRHSKSWKINLKVHVIGLESKKKVSVLANLSLEITEFAAGPAENSERTVKLPVKCCVNGSSFEARLVVKFDVSEFQSQHVDNIIHPLSPTHLLLSLSLCASFQTQAKNDDRDSSASESNEDTVPTYQSIVTMNRMSVQPVYDSLEYETHTQMEEMKEDLLNYEVQEKTSLKRLLSWNSRKIIYKGPDDPSNTPLLNKAYGEGGGDDIDNARRSLLTSLQPREGQFKSDFEHSGFMDSDRFEIGNWAKSKVISRDGKLKLVTDVFLASIDQRSEKASGGGACTVLAAVITDWLHHNPSVLPIRCQLDKLIRDGSSEWRSLCKEETHGGKFLDQHFDLDTVIQAQVRPLKVVPEKSYVGFFELENMLDKLELLQGAMSFDGIWEELERNGSTSDEQIYIVSWNDHFFVLKIENDTMYIIDTLGERLSEGCNKAYMIKFNKESVVLRVQPESRNTKLNSEEGLGKIPSNVGQEHENRDIICKGKSCCKEFIKGFLAALPLAELQSNIERGIVGRAPLHQLLQIEFQYMTPCEKNSLTPLKTS